VNLGIAGRTALVVGATGGLGGAVARALAREGVRVAVAGRSEEAAVHAAEEISGSGADALGIRLDLTDGASVDAALAATRARLGDVDILFNNSGGPPPTAAAGQPLELWREHFEAMVAGVIGLTDRVLPGMRERRWGRVLTNTGSGVVAPIPNLALSNALRLSLVGWSKTLAREVAADGVTVNIVVPGRIATRRVRALDEARAQREGISPDDARAAAIAAIPTGRYGEPDEYGAAVAFLAGEPASYITGTMLRIDGGQIPSI
jgi:3-oxoacyl-[acyl-carrier protein] reductase